jgi:hypothetical protein
LWIDRPDGTFDERRARGVYTLAALLEAVAGEHRQDGGPLGLVVAAVLRSAAADARRRGLLTPLAWLRARARRRRPD